MQVAHSTEGSIDAKDCSSLSETMSRGLPRD